MWFESSLLDDNNIVVIGLKICLAYVHYLNNVESNPGEPIQFLLAVLASTSNSKELKCGSRY